MDVLFTPFSVMQQETLGFLFAVVLLCSLMIGSFLNVVIYRLPEMLKRQWRDDAAWVLAEDAGGATDAAGEEETAERFNLATPPSRCPSCQTRIKWWQNIPVLSYLCLRGRCGACQTKISIRYPLVEFFTLVVATLVMLHSETLLQALPLLLLSFGLIVLVMIDVDHQLLPDNLTLPLLWLGLLLNSQGLFVSLHDALYGAVAGFLSLWTVFWAFKFATGKEGMGYGDFKLLAVFGAWFGWQVLPNVILLSSLVGALWGIGLMVFFKRDSQKPMAFGPFIAVAGWLTYMYPQWFTVMRYFGA